MTEPMARLSPRGHAARHEQRDHAGHEGEGGHQDRPQPIAVGLDDGVEARQALGPEGNGVVDPKNRVLLDHADSTSRPSAV
jgi:hypothetical protein